MDAAKNVRVTGVSAGFIGVALLAFTAACSPGAPRGKGDVAPELTFDNLAFRVYRGPALEAFGTARTASFRRDSADVTASGADVSFPPSPGRPQARLTAAAGHGNLRARWFVAEGGVRATQGAQVAETERARYDAADGLVRGDAHVVVRGPGFTAEGEGFTLDPRDATVRLVGGTRVVAGRRQ
jgi:lipopolysaccharide export system protein LptC